MEKPKLVLYCSDVDIHALLRGMTVKRVFIANPHGFCAGVRRAVKAVERALDEEPGAVYCLNEIVHNQQVVSSLRQRGVIFVTDAASVPRGGCLLFSAHGIPPSVRDVAKRQGLRVVDATCPFVEKLHAEVRRFAAEDYTILLIGHRGHDEIVGVKGEAPEHVRVVENCEEAATVEVPDASRVAVVTQTTLSVDDSMRVVSLLRRRFPDIILSPQANICNATSGRQIAVKELACRAHSIIVLGSRNSSNSRRLVEVAESCGATACLVSDISELSELDLSDISDIGLTAGASTPDSFIEDVLVELAKSGFGDVVPLSPSMNDASF